MREKFENSDNSELLAVIGALLDAVNDKNDDVKTSVIESIETISKQNPNVVIHAAVYFWELHKKISTEHMASLLNVLASACRYSDANLNADLASSVAELAVNELTGNNQDEAAELLIALAKTHCIQAMGGLLTKLEPGIFPHNAIPYTIGKIAAANSDGILSFVKLTLTIILPMLNQIREEILKQTICLMVGKFCEAINDCIINENMESEINKQTYNEEICSVFDIFTCNWLKTVRDFKSTEAVLMALVPMIPLLPHEIDNEKNTKLIPICLSLCKKQQVRLAAVKVLAIILNCASENDKETFRPFIEPIHQTLFEYVSICPFEATRYALLTHYEVLQCSRSLVVLYPEEGLDRILQQLKCSITNQRVRALIVLRHLINTLPPEDDATLHRIALNLQDSLGDSGTLQTVGAIVALAARPSFPLLPSQRAIFVRYMVSHCGTKKDETEAYTEALFLLANTVDGAEVWLWPCLIRALLDPVYVASATAVLHALSPLATKIIHNENFSMTERDFPGAKVLGRCLELLSDRSNRLAVVTFLKVLAPLVGHRIKPYWDEKLLELTYFLQEEQKYHVQDSKQRDLIWEEKVVDWLEESVKLEGESWGAKLADELALKSNVPQLALLLAATCNSDANINLLVELTRSHGTTKEFARAVGICSKRQLDLILKAMEWFCSMEDTRKAPVKLLGFVKDTKAAATAEAAKAGLLQSYAEIAQRGNLQEYFLEFEKHALPWTIRQLNECKELSTKEAGLSVLEHVGNAIYSTASSESKELHIKTTALATLLGILQSSAGYKPLQLYPAILRAAISLIRIPPVLNNDERRVFLSTVLDKAIGASSEIILQLHPDILQQVVHELGTLSSEIISDSADALADFFDILLPWMQSKSNVERRITISVLHTVLESYYNSIKYTYPGGKLDAGKLVGRVLSWCADIEFSLRSLIVDCVSLSLNIASRHRSVLPDNVLSENFKQIKEDITNDDSTIFFLAIKNLAKAVSKKIPNGEITSLAEGLIEGLLFRGEAGLVAGVALSQHFQIRGSEILKTDVCLVDNIIAQIRQMENITCKRSAAVAIISLMKHHTEDVIERLLSQPLPLDQGTELCWKEIGNDDHLGHRALELLLIKLDTNNLFAENVTNVPPGKNNTASFTSLAIIIALRHLLQSSNAENLIDRQLPSLLSILLRYLAGWLHVDAPASVINTKFGYVPNREACKVNPHTEVYSVLTNILTIVDPNIASSLLNEAVFSSETQAEESMISTVGTLLRCTYSNNNVVSDMAQSLAKLLTSTIAMQRAVAAAFYAELIGKVDYGIIWLDNIIHILHEAKADSSPLVRKLATIGLARIAYLASEKIDEYFDNCLDALLEGLEEPASGEGGSEIILESLRGLSVLLPVQSKTSINPRVVLALKPFVEKENWEMRFAAISALGAIAANWQKSILLNDELADYFLGCLPCLIIKLEDSNIMVVKTTQETLCKAANIMQCEKLSHLIHTNLGPQVEFNFERFSRDMIQCLKENLPQRADELRNAIVRGYSISENKNIRAASALLLGLFGSPRPEDIQRLLQLLRDTESIVRIRASRALSFCFTL